MPRQIYPAIDKSPDSQINMTSNEKTEYRQARDNFIKTTLAKIEKINAQKIQREKLESEPELNEDLYLKVKPVLIAACHRYERKDMDVTEFARRLIRTLHSDFDIHQKIIKTLLPYMSQFMEEIQGSLLNVSEVPYHLLPMQISAFRQLPKEVQEKHKMVADILMKGAIVSVIKDIMESKIS